MVRAFVARRLFALLAGVGILGMSYSAAAQTWLGRTAATGDWNDGAWIDDLGNAASPNSGSSVFIGDASSVPGSFEPATVDLSSVVDVTQVSLGSVFDGNLNVLSGGDLTASSGIYVNQGSFSVDFGGTAATPYFYLGSAGATATLDGTVSFTFVSGQSGATLNVNSDQSFTNVQFDNATLNQSGNLVADTVTLNSTVWNRFGGVTLSTNDLSIGGGSYTYDGTDSIGQFYGYAGTTFVSNSDLSLTNWLWFDGGATAQLNANVSANTFYIGAGSTAEVNANVSVNNTQLNEAQITLNSGTISGDLYLAGSTSATGIIRTGGTLSLASLWVDGSQAQLSIEAGDSVAGTLYAYNGGTLTINSAQTVSLVNISNSTLNLNASLNTQSLQLENANLQRAAGVVMNTQDLTLVGQNYAYDGVDSVSQSINLYGGGMLSIDTSMNLGSFLSLEGPGSTADLNASFQTPGGVYVYNDAKLNLNADLEAALVDINAGQLEMNGGTLVANDLVISNGASIVRNGGSFDVGRVYLDQASSLGLTSADIVSNAIELYGTSVLDYVQDDGIVDGLDLAGYLVINDTGELHLEFDGMQSIGLDWALRLVGDQQTLLQDFIDAGKLTFSGGTDPIGIIYNPGQYGDFTYIGYVSAVPEPGALAMLLPVAVAVATKRRRLPSVA